MNLDNNIENAFKVVRKTYENLDKLMKFLDEISIENGYEPSAVRFLRYGSDSDYKGWMYSNLIKLYQLADDNLLENKWRQGALYSVEFSLIDSPRIIVSKFDFNIETWTSGIGMDKVYYFSKPVNRRLKYEFEHIQTDDYWKSVPLIDVSKRYWDLNYAISREFKLTEINSNNAEKLVFNEFDKMRNME